MDSMDWLVKDKPSIFVDPNDIHFIKTPTEFYETIIERIRTAKKQIIFASLYLGTGELETKLVEELKTALEKNPELKIYILLDYLRGTRGAPLKSSSTMLQPLSDRAHVFFYHTPDLRGMFKNMLPARMNEIVGLQHMKANLSDSYFVDRQDRYVLINNSPDLVGFFKNVFEAVSSSSFELKPDGNLTLHEDCGFHPFEGDKNEYCSYIKSKIAMTMEKLKKSTEESKKSSDTLVYPFLQFGPFGINDEVEMLSKLFSRSQPDLDVTVTTGYFNPFENYLDVILKSSNYPMKFLFAAPDANGFYNAEGFSGYIPSLYIDVSRNFLNQCQTFKKNIKLYEFSRPKWTFHGKGIWIEDEKNKISGTMLGSSNYGYRSACRDLESQVFLVTSNENLRSRLREEKNALFEFSTLIDSTTFLKRDHFKMVLAQGLGLGYLTAQILAKVRATAPAAVNVTQKATLLTKSECRSREIELRAKERIPSRQHEKNFSSNAFNSEELRKRIGGYSIRRIQKREASTDSSSKMTQAELEEALKDEKWVAVYRFPGIVICSFISKAKFVQTIASALVIPWVVYLYTSGQQPLSFLITGCGAALLAPFALVGFTKTFNKMIGVISMTESKEYIRIGYLSFYGSRRNVIFPLADIVPLTDLYNPENPEKVLKMTPEPRQRRSRVCYSNTKSDVLPRPRLDEKRENLKIQNLHSFLEEKKEWISVIRYRWIALSVLLLRARLFFTAFLIIFVIYATTQYLLSNATLELPLISLCLGILCVGIQNFILRSHERVISEIFVDSEQLYVKAKYLTPWGVLRFRFATADSVMLTNYVRLDGSDSETFDETHLLWRETGWEGSLKIPVNGVEIVNQSLAMNLFGDIR
ncbi:hypothetical protein FO519_009391 [Halicephalobus sp. NKZ332]|nr:hypothetical protein FO519_009391 [Halicephalobus sp. NKZ332]